MCIIEWTSCIKLMSHLSNEVSEHGSWGAIQKMTSVAGWEGISQIVTKGRGLFEFGADWEGGGQKIPRIWLTSFVNGPWWNMRHFVYICGMNLSHQMSLSPLLVKCQDIVTFPINGLTIFKIRESKFITLNFDNLSQMKVISTRTVRVSNYPSAWLEFDNQLLFGQVAERVPDPRAGRRCVCTETKTSLLHL